MFQKEACHGIISLQEARKRKNNPEVVVIEDESFTGIEMQTYVQLGRRLEDIGEGTSAKGIEFVYHILPGEQKTLYYDVSTVPDFIPQRTDEGEITGYIVQGPIIDGMKSTALAIIGEPGRISEVRLYQEPAEAVRALTTPGTIIEFPSA